MSSNPPFITTASFDKSMRIFSLASGDEFEDIIGEMRLGKKGGDDESDGGDEDIYRGEWLLNLEGLNRRSAQVEAKAMLAKAEKERSEELAEQLQLLSI